MESKEIEIILRSGQRVKARIRDDINQTMEKLHKALDEENFILMKDRTDFQAIFKTDEIASIGVLPK